MSDAQLTRFLSLWSLPRGLSSCCWSRGEWIPANGWELCPAEALKLSAQKWAGSVVLIWAQKCFSASRRARHFICFNEDVAFSGSRKYSLITDSVLFCQHGNGWETLLVSDGRTFFFFFMAWQKEGLAEEFELDGWLNHPVDVWGGGGNGENKIYCKCHKQKHRVHLEIDKSWREQRELRTRVEGVRLEMQVSGECLLLEEGPNLQVMSPDGCSQHCESRWTGLNFHV